VLGTLKIWRSRPQWLLCHRSVYEESTEAQRIFIWLLAVSVVNLHLLHILMLRQTATEKKLGEVLLNPKCIKEVSSVEAEQGRPSSGLCEERLNGERHFSDRKERGKWPL
jgi:hypothetical protein